MPTSPLTLAIRPRTPMLPTAGGETFIAVSVTGSADSAQRERRPLNLALVLDRSGSMGGEKLSLVKNAALHLVQQLSPRDRVAIVTYDDEIMVLEPGTQVTPDALPSLSMMLAAIQAWGGTNLEGGWRAGVQAVAEGMEAMPGALHRVLLLTDGLANIGITDTNVLASLAKGVASIGVVTSTFGVGTDYDEQLLNVMAEAGSGNDYFIATPDAIRATFQAELTELMGVVAEGVTVSITLPAALGATLVNPQLELTTAGETHTVPVGFVGAGETRHLVFRISAPPAPVGTIYDIAALARWTKPAQGNTVTAAYRWTVAADAGADDPAVQEAVIAQQAARARWEAYRQEKAGDHRGAVQTLNAAANDLMNAPAPLAASYIAEFRSEADEMAQGSSDEQRKRMYSEAMRLKRSRRDYRDKP